MQKSLKTQKSFVHCLRFIITELQAQTFKLEPAFLLSLQHSKVNADSAAAQAVTEDSS